MKSKICLAIFALWANMAFSQNGWVGAGIPIKTLQINCLFNDSLANKLYAGGQILNPSFSSMAIVSYDGFSWNIIGNANHQTRSITRFNNDIIASGFFTMIGGVSVNSIARFDGISWHPFGNFNSGVWKVKVINNELYAMGTFSMVDSIPCKSIAKWNGVSWQPVYNFPFNSTHVYDAELFQGDLYVGGNGFETPSANFNDIAVYKNGSWQMVGDGILGFASVVDKLLVYKNELYVGGLIWRSAGNSGDGIQKWNGSTWSDLGMGLRNGLSPTGSQPHVYDMKIYNNELYVAGLFDFADSLQAKSLAKWDGEKWCNFPTADFISTNLVVDIYQDTIFTGCGYDTLNGDTINYLAKMLTLQPLGCRATDIIESSTTSELVPIVVPNPATNIITIKNLPKHCSIEIYNSMGQLELSLNENLTPEINIEILETGLHYFKVNSNDEDLPKIVKFIKMSQ